jgi:hypothetical protein
MESCLAVPLPNGEIDSGSKSFGKDRETAQKFKRTAVCHPFFREYGENVPYVKSGKSPSSII